MKFVLSDVLAMHEAVLKLTQMQFKASTAFKIARLSKALTVFKNDFEESRLKAFKKRGTPNEKGNIHLEGDAAKEVTLEVVELLKVEVDLEIPASLKMEDFDDVEIDPQTLIPLLPIIQE